MDITYQRLYYVYVRRIIYRRTIIEKTIVIEIKIYFKIRSRDLQFEIRLNNARYPSDKILKFDSSTKID